MAIRWIEDCASVKPINNDVGLLQALATAITNGLQDEVWKLAYPESINLINDVFTISYVVGENTVYVEFYLPKEFTYTKDDREIVKSNYHFLEIKFGTNYTNPVDNETPGTWEEDCDSVRSRFAWFKTQCDTNVKKWLPVHFWMSVTKDNISIILEGSPSASMENRLISFGYIGKINPFREDVGTREGGNFGVTTSSDISPFDYLTEEEINKYSDYTGTGVTDFTMLESHGGFPMQGNYISFNTPDEFVHKQIEGPSAFTKKYHMTPVYVFHGLDGYRGRLKNVISFDRSTVINQDKLINTYIRPCDPNKPLVNDRYKVFLVNAPYSIFNNSDNVMYGVALLTDTDYEVSLEIDPPATTVDITKQNTVALNAIYTYSMNATNVAIQPTSNTESETTAEAQNNTLEAQAVNYSASANDTSTTTHLSGKYNATDESTWNIEKHNTSIVIDKGIVTNIDTPGKYEVTAKYMGHTARGIVVVPTPPPPILKIEPVSTEVTVPEGATFTIQLSIDNGVTWQDGTNMCNWSVDKQSININKGIIASTTVNDEGDVIVKAEYKGVTAKANLKVVLPPPQIKIEPTTQSILIGNTATYVAKVSLDGGTTWIDSPEIIWSINDDNEFITNGVTSAIANEGTYKITASYKDISTTATLRVTDVLLKITPEEKLLMVGKKASFKVQSSTDGGNSWEDVTSKCTFNSDVDISASGGVTAKEENVGEHTITATYEGKNVTAKLIITNEVDHSYDYKFVMEWDAESDYDFYAIPGSEDHADDDSYDVEKNEDKINMVSYVEKTYSDEDDTGHCTYGIWLDKDITLPKIQSGAEGKEIITVYGEPDSIIYIKCNHYTNDDDTDQNGNATVNFTAYRNNSEDVKNPQDELLKSTSITGLKLSKTKGIFKLDLTNGTVTVL